MESESAPPNTTNTTTTATAVAVAAVAAEAEVVISSTSAVTDAPVVVVVAGSKRTHEELEAAVVVAVNEYSASSVSANVPQDSHPAAAVAPAAEDDSHSASAAKRQMIHDPNAQIFKIQLGNLSKYTDKKKLSKWCEAAFTEKGVSVPANMKVKTVPAWTHAILTFEVNFLNSKTHSTYGRTTCNTEIPPSTFAVSQRYGVCCRGL